MKLRGLVVAIAMLVFMALAAQGASAAPGSFSTNPKRVSLRCDSGSFCSIQLIVTTDGPVVLSYHTEGAFWVISGSDNCPGDGVTSVNGQCQIRLVFNSGASGLGRFTGVLVITDGSTGFTRNVRLAARIT